MIEIYKAILDSTPHKIVFVNTEHIIVYMNKVAVDFLKKRKLPNLIGKSIFDCHNVKSNKKIIEVFERFQNGGEEEFLSITKDNERKYITPVRSKSGELLGYYERDELNEKWDKK
jgi:DUF438 domain-containing protein